MDAEIVTSPETTIAVKPEIAFVAVMSAYRDASGRIGADANLNVGQSGGNQGTPSLYFKGMIDDIQIHRTALTSEQVLEKFQR